MKQTVVSKGDDNHSRLAFAAFLQLKPKNMTKGVLLNSLYDYFALCK